MWFLRKKQKIENNVLPELSEYKALEELVQRLEQTPILSKEEQTKKHKKFINNVTYRMINEGVNRGLAADDHEMYSQSTYDFKAHLKAIDNNLMEQISIFNFGLNRWFEYGESHPPYFPQRIAVILSKRKELEKEKQFLVAYCRHFKFTYQEMTYRAVRKGAISSYGIPNKEEILSIAQSLIRDHGLNARFLSDEMCIKARENGSEADLFQKSLVRYEVMRITHSDFIRLKENL